MGKSSMRSLIALLFLCGVFLSWPHFEASAVHAGGKNTLNFDNRSGEDVVVRVFDQNSNNRIAEVKVSNAKTKGTSIADGQYYIVAKYLGQPNKDGKTSPTYSKGDSFTIKPATGKRSVVTITLHRVVNGNYGSAPTDEKTFER